MSSIEIPDPDDDHAVDEFLESEPTVDDWLAEKRELPVALEKHAVRMYLGPLGYVANDDDTWDCDIKDFPELRTELNSHEKLGGYTHYRIDCALHTRGCEEPYLAWCTMRRLEHIRLGIHHPVKLELGEQYEQHFHSTRFARYFGPSGTTARLNAWFSTLSRCINEGLFNPELVAGILRVFDSPPIGQNIFDESVFGKLLVDSRGVEPLPMDTWSAVQNERAAPEPELVIAQLLQHEVVEPTPRQLQEAPGQRKKLGGASKGAYGFSDGHAGIAQPGVNGHAGIAQPEADVSFGIADISPAIAQPGVDQEASEAATGVGTSEDDPSNLWKLAEQPDADVPQAFVMPLPKSEVGLPQTTAFKPEVGLPQAAADVPESVQAVPLVPESARPQAGLKTAFSAPALKPVVAEDSPQPSPRSPRVSPMSSPRQL